MYIELAFILAKAYVKHHFGPANRMVFFNLRFYVLFSIFYLISSSIMPAEIGMLPNISVYSESNVEMESFSK